MAQEIYMRSYWHFDHYPIQRTQPHLKRVMIKAPPLDNAELIIAHRHTIAATRLLLICAKVRPYLAMRLLEDNLDFATLAINSCRARWPLDGLEKCEVVAAVGRVDDENMKLDALIVDVSQQYARIAIGPGVDRGGKI